MADTKTITLKLLIDTKANRVLFAEASKDFVDFLFFLLSLPVGTVINLLTGKTMTGSIGNLHSSFANLKEMYLQPNLQKNILLNPKPSISSANFPLLAATSEDNSYKIPETVYTCSSQYCKSAVVDTRSGATCPGCRNYMTTGVTYIARAAGASSSGSNKAPNGFVQQVVTYMMIIPSGIS